MHAITCSAFFSSVRRAWPYLAVSSALFSVIFFLAGGKPAGGLAQVALPPPLVTVARDHVTANSLDTGGALVGNWRYSPNVHLIFGAAGSYLAQFRCFR